MTEPAGKRLNKARMERGLTIEEVAHATRVRPEQLVALENGDYSRFASNAYAKSFLQIYARHLGVDVHDEVAALDSNLPVSISDYQYLTNAPVREPEIMRPQKAKKPSIVPVIAFACLLVVAAIIFNLYQNGQRLDRERSSAAAKPAEPAESSATATATPAPAAPVRSSQPSAVTPAPAINPVVQPQVPPNPAPSVAPSLQTENLANAAPAPSTAAAPSVPAATPFPPLISSEVVPPPPPPMTPAPAPIAPNTAPAVIDGTPVLRAIPVPRNTPGTPPGNAAANAAAATPAPIAVNGTMNEVIVTPLKKTWVRIYKETPNSAPVFADFLYPSGEPLRLKGGKFFIDASDPSSVKVSRNGQPIAFTRERAVVE